MVKKSVNPQNGEITTGEVITYREPVTALAVPDMSTVTEVQAVAGKNPPGVNLKDHPEYDGLSLIVTRARIASGEDGEYIIATGFVFPETVKPTMDHAVTIITGSENVYNRVVAAMEQNAFPIKGRLRKGGRAWFLD